MHRDSPSGTLFARSGPGSFSVVTGNWVQEGTRLFLQDVSNGQPLTPEFTLDSVTLHVTTAAPVGSITADPNPFVPDSRGLGETTLAWTSYGTTRVEIHVDAPNGPGFISGGPGSFSVRTPRWVQDGQTFFLQNVSNGLPLTAANTLATVTVSVLRPPPHARRLTTQVADQTINIEAPAAVAELERVAPRERGHRLWQLLGAWHRGALDKHRNEHS